MVFHAHLQSAKAVLAEYNGQQPFSVFLKSFFKQHKKFGSRDRKNISELCYAYLRLGKALPELGVEEKIKIGLFLCTAQKNPLLQFFQPEWYGFLEQQDFPGIAERISFIHDRYSSFRAEAVFSFSGDLSDSIDKKSFILSHFQQPDLFIRIRPGYEAQVLYAIKETQAPAAFLPPATVRLPNAYRVETIGETDKEIVIQDYSSQRTGTLLKDIRGAAGAPMRVWDCCAASGGKAIMAYDLLPNITLDVSDVRKSILENLSVRFSRAGIKDYRSFVKDLAADPASSGKHPQGISESGYDLIIVDAPCSGSGTWGRIPEQLSFFKAAEIERYARLQEKIVANTIPHLRKNGCLLYITCSVFKEENENMAKIIQEKWGLHLLDMQLINGYELKADTMFAALLTASPA